MTWALILASQRHLVSEASSLPSGGWQRRVGGDLHSRTLGLLRIGNIDGPVAQFGRAFGIEVIGWSQNLTAEKAGAVGATAVVQEELFAGADILIIHTLLSRRTRGLVNAEMIATMKPTAWLVNTSRAAIVDEPAILDALVQRPISGFAVDVFDVEPLPSNHPFRTLDNVVATPHLGFVAESVYRTFFEDCVHNIVQWLDSEGSGPTHEVDKPGPGAVAT